MHNCVAGRTGEKGLQEHYPLGRLRASNTFWAPFTMATSWLARLATKVSSRGTILRVSPEDRLADILRMHHTTVRDLKSPSPADLHFL